MDIKVKGYLDRAENELFAEQSIKNSKFFCLTIKHLIEKGSN